MIPSPTGLLVCLALLLIGRAMGSPVLVGLMMSLAFGSTAFAVLPSLGGSSPLIYTLFALILVVRVVCRRDGLNDFAAELVRHRACLLVLLLIVYVAGTAVILPRLFQGDVGMFDLRQSGGLEVPLAPSTGNITQSGYFVLGGLTCLLLCIELRRPGALAAMELGFVAWVGMNVGLGLLDLLGKLAGAGDVLLPIRTASYALLTDDISVGFYRIAGGHSEASAFATALFPGLVFIMTYWRITQGRLAFALMLLSLGMLMLSTSSTGYACLGAYMLWLAISASLFPFRGGPRRSDLILAGVILVGVTVCLGIYLLDDSAFSSVRRLLEEALLNKSQSSSAQERGYANDRSIQVFFETGGIGIGMGSSRASNWLIAMLSQTGIIGTTLLLVLAGLFLRPPPRPAGGDTSALALHESARAAGLWMLVPAIISSGNADPGILFFICLATVLSCRDALAAAPPGLARRSGRLPVVPVGRIANAPH
ncbi:hypothetical protein NVS89_02500 [Ancylobacter sp. MQZ15Z-1]|uniref:O-antigen ligase domain-containing protein n=1 Tax=Ancylobacter mangrovi TaxID=2972472 RepID=A0A9X2PBQ2_9HYPH|nr:hypothetical protein [Ancylobacter mangrovi]MCS0493951.1 hypothetical protein [Ancylobacter mangrovi]